jgi:23S rRNA pseudouridine1911/1915/1917 synthase
MTAPEASERRLSLLATEEHERLDLYLAHQIPEITRSQARRLVREGLVTVNNAAARAARPVRRGDMIAVFIPAEAHGPVAEELPLSVLYEDEDVAVIDKPAGMVVHPAPGHANRTMVNALLSRYPSLAAEDSPRPGIVHRLDKDTSGLMVVALNLKSRDWLIAQFKGGKVRKTYVALVVGALTGEGCIEGAIGRHPAHRKRMAVLPGGKPARTGYTVLERLGDFTLIEARPVTGRTHQIRVHCAHIGHPVAGDITYGRRTTWRSLEPYLTRHFLHAAKLSLTLPGSEDRSHFTSVLPVDLQAALDHARHLALTAPCPSQCDMV